jgi:hypothetical protein
MDEAASDYLRNLKLSSAAAAIAWGYATVEWGPEAYTKLKPSR